MRGAMNLKFVRAGEKHLKRLNEIVNDPRVSRFLTVSPPVSMKSTVKWFNRNKEMKNLWWAAIVDGEIVGSISLMRKGITPRIRLYQSRGFKREGVMKKFMKIGRKYHDAVMMSAWLR